MAAALSGVVALTGSAIPAAASDGRSAARPGLTCGGSPAAGGGVCILKRDNGYDVAFASEVRSTADFNLVTSSGTYGDEGSFEAYPGGDYSYFFAVGYKSWAHVCVYSRDNVFAPICSPDV